MNKPQIDPNVTQAAMQRLVDEGRAEWATVNGQRALKLTELGKAMIRLRRGEETVQ